MMATSIFPTIGMYIRPTKLLEISASNIEYHLKKDSVKEVPVQIEVMMVKLGRLWLQTTTKMIMKKIFKKKIGD